MIAELLADLLEAFAVAAAREAHARLHHRPNSLWIGLVHAERVRACTFFLFAFDPAWAEARRAVRLSLSRSVGVA